MHVDGKKSVDLAAKILNHIHVERSNLHLIPIMSFVNQTLKLDCILQYLHVWEKFSGLLTLNINAKQNFPLKFDTKYSRLCKTFACAFGPFFLLPSQCLNASNGTEVSILKPDLVQIFATHLFTPSCCCW